MIEIDRELIVNAITYCGNQSIHHTVDNIKGLNDVQFNGCLETDFTIDR